jgi:hypothetical protein
MKITCLACGFETGDIEELKEHINRQHKIKTGAD